MRLEMLLFSVNIRSNYGLDFVNYFVFGNCYLSLSLHGEKNISWYLNLPLLDVKCKGIHGMGLISNDYIFLRIA